jgi:hypothetical protein
MAMNTQTGMAANIIQIKLLRFSKESNLRSKIVKIMDKLCLPNFPSFVIVMKQPPLIAPLVMSNELSRAVSSTFALF